MLFGLYVFKRGMMKHEKLTLRMDEVLIEKAKRVAKEHDTSVSGMVAGFFEALEGERSRNQEHGPITRRLRGSLRPGDGKPGSEEEDYLRHLEEKHG